MDTIIAAVEQNGLALRYIALNICRKAVKQNISEEIKNTKQYPEICLIAVKNCGKAIQFIPAKFQTEAIKQNYESIQFIHPDNRTQEMCLDGGNLKFVTKELKNEELCLIAINN
jgi:hypothetical protein